MLLLVLLTLAGLYLVQLLADGLASVVLSVHFQTFIQDGKAALGLDNLPPEIVIIFFHKVPAWT